MKGIGFNSEPGYLSHIDRQAFAGARKTAGISQAWNMPIALFDLHEGFSNRSDPGVIRHHTLKWRVAGAQVHSETRGGCRSDPMIGQPICLQSRESRALYWSKGAMRCAHIYFTDDMLRDLGHELHEERGDKADILHEDIPFSEDRFLAELSHSYLARGLNFDCPSILEMDARSLAIGAHLVLNYSVLSSRARRKLPDKLQADKLSKALELMCSKIGGTLRLADLANETGMSAFHFCRAFNLSVGMPPHRWLIALRIERAKSLLKRSQLPISEISAALGYDDPSYFARLFRKQVGLSPNEFRARS